MQDKTWYSILGLDAEPLFLQDHMLNAPQKVAYLWQLGVSFLCSPECPKQPGTSFPFYKFFYTIVSLNIEYDVLNLCSTTLLGLGILVTKFVPNLIQAIVFWDHRKMDFRR